jgi:hypothetical protein
MTNDLHAMKAAPEKMGLAFASFSHLSGLHGYYLLKSRNPWVIRMNGVSE